MTLTDLPSELPLLRENVETNRGSPPHCPVTVKPLKWGDAAAMGSVGTNFDVVLCSDALYQNDEVTQRALCDTLFGLCDGVTPGRILFAYNFRENLAADAGFFGATGNSSVIRRSTTWRTTRTSGCSSTDQCNDVDLIYDVLVTTHS